MIDFKLDFSKESQDDFGKHRHGWSYVLSELNKLINIENDSIELKTFYEKIFWEPTKLKDKMLNEFENNWIGILHNPPNCPKELQVNGMIPLYSQTPKCFLENKYLRGTFRNCKGIYVLSNHHKQFLDQEFKKYNMNIPVNSLLHPTETPELKWEWNYFQNNKEKRLVNIGTWLRKFRSICDIKVPSDFKQSLMPNTEMLNLYINIEKKVFGDFQDSHVEKIPLVDDKTYDMVLCQNICFLDLYDTSANNIVTECIGRNTPLLVNKVGGITDYLGEKYPFYYSSLKEAEEKLNNNQLILDTHNYLKEMDKSKFTIDYFLKSILNSEIYKSISST